MEQQKKSNILFIITDQQQKQTIDNDSYCFTPNIDRFKSEAVTFSRAYAGNAVCSPSRTCLFTGLLPHQHGVDDNIHCTHEYRANLSVNTNMLSSHLKKEGYSLGYFGKWHIERSGRLENYGFDEYELFEGRQRVDEFPWTFIKKNILKNKGYKDIVLSGVIKETEEQTEEYYLFSRAVDFIEKASRSSQEPWCVFVSANRPHDPYVAPEEFYSMYNPESIKLPASFKDEMKDKPAIYGRMQNILKDMSEADFRELIACYYANCTLIDAQVGRILEKLRETGQMDNTIIVYTSDHGDMMGAHRLLCKGVAPFEEAYNIPLLIRWPRSGLENNVCDVYINNYDIAPTLLEIAGCSLMKNIDGESVLPYIRGERRGDMRFAFAEMMGNRFGYTQRILWRDQCKYVFNGFDYDEFYDLEKDPHEMVNRIDDPEYKELIEQMSAEIWNILKKSGDHPIVRSNYYTFRFAPVGPG